MNNSQRIAPSALNSSFGNGDNISIASSKMSQIKNKLHMRMVIRMTSKFGNKNFPLIKNLLEKHLDNYTHVDASVIADLESKI